MKTLLVSVCAVLLLVLNVYTSAKLSGAQKELQESRSKLETCLNADRSSASASRRVATVSDPYESVGTDPEIVLALSGVLAAQQGALAREDTPVDAGALAEDESSETIISSCKPCTDHSECRAAQGEHCYASAQRKRCQLAAEFNAGEPCLNLGIQVSNDAVNADDDAQGDSIEPDVLCTSFASLRAAANYFRRSSRFATAEGKCAHIDGQSYRIAGVAKLQSGQGPAHFITPGRRAYREGLVSAGVTQALIDEANPPNVQHRRTDEWMYGRNYNLIFFAPSGR